MLTALYVNTIASLTSGIGLIREKQKTKNKNRVKKPRKELGESLVDQIDPN